MTEELTAELPLDPLLPTGEPFTPLMARSVGVDRAALERMLRHGVLRRVVKGVYVDAMAPDTRELRGSALQLVVPATKVVHGRTASWLYGVPVSSGGGAVETTTGRHLQDRDVTTVGGLRTTTPLRTAMDLGRTLNPDRGITVLDAFLRHELVRHAELLAELPRFAGLGGIRRLRELVARADGRAGSAAESVLRMRWLDARLPTPIPRLGIESGWVELGLPVRRFGASFTGRMTASELARLTMDGWWIVQLDAPRVLGSDPVFVSEHLEREFHQHLLRQAG